jgi:hypothetical protein
MLYRYTRMVVTRQSRPTTVRSVYINSSECLMSDRTYFCRTALGTEKGNVVVRIALVSAVCIKPIYRRITVDRRRNNDILYLLN